MELLCLPGRQRGLHALRQGAGGRRFIELVLWSRQRPQHAHCSRTCINKVLSPHCTTVHTLSFGGRVCPTSLGGGVAVCVLDDQIVQVGGVAVLCHDELGPVIHGQRQETLHNLSRDGFKERSEGKKQIRDVSVCCIISLPAATRSL